MGKTLTETTLLAETTTISAETTTSGRVPPGWGPGARAARARRAHAPQEKGGMDLWNDVDRSPRSAVAVVAADAGCYC